MIIRARKVKRVTASIELRLYTSVTSTNGAILDSAKMFFEEGSKGWSFKGEIFSDQFNMGQRISL
jgi:hypothetical protein